MSIILTRAGSDPVRLNRTTIADEDFLQQYIYEHPETLPFDQLEEGARPFVLCREFPTSSGPIDALATDDSANLYLIETKLYKNPDKRLVLAQVLDYGAALWKEYEDPDDFVTRLDLLLMGRGGEGLSARLGKTYSLAGDALAAFLQNLKNIVAEGEFRFVVLMDHVDDRLKDLIAYVNANSKFDLFGVGLDFYEHQDTRILIPTLYGAETKKSTSTSRSERRTWDYDSFFLEAANRLDPTAVSVMKDLHAWAVDKASEISYGTGKKGSFTPKFEVLGFRGPISVYSDGTLQLKLNPSWYQDTENGSSFRPALISALTEEGLIIAGMNDSDVYLKTEVWRSKVVPLTRAILSALSAVAGSHD